MSAEPLSTIDGRRARRDQNRDRVVDALLEIYREGNLQPAVAEVAERSGVSHRSVFRYFEDLDELYRVAIERQFLSLLDHFHISGIGEGPLRDRVDAIVENRMRIYEKARYPSRVGQMLAPVEPVIAAHRRDLAARAVDQIEQHFRPELAELDAPRRRATSETLALVLSLDSIEYLQQVRGLDVDAAAAAVKSSIFALLGTPAT